MEEVYRRLSLLSEPVRVRLLSVLADEELGVGELCRVLQLPQSTVSRHLKALHTASVVRKRTEGTRSLFRAVGADPEWQALWALVSQPFVASHQHLEDQARLEAVLAERRVESSSFFGRAHAQWDGLRKELFGEWFPAQTLAALLPPDATVVDLGCGTGANLALLAPWVRRAVGVDRERAMLDVAQARLQGIGSVELVQAKLRSVPLEDHTVDLALCTLVLHHLKDPFEVFAEVARLLRPGGRFVLVDMVAHDRADWRHTMGHRWLGFEAEQLLSWGEQAGLPRGSVVAMTPDPEAAGPPLQVGRWG
jgi:ArsR family transcriptional regulator